MIPEVQWRFGERYLVTEFIQHQNVAVREIASSLPKNNQDEFVLAASVHIRDYYFYPLDDAKNPSTSGQLLRYRKGFMSYHFKRCESYVWALPCEVINTKCGYCLIPETEILVITSQGYKYRQIKDIQNGDSIVSHTGKLQKVTQTYKRYVDEDLVVLTLENGETIKVTGNHPIYTKEGWVKAEDLNLSSILLKIYDTATEGFFRSLRGENNPNWRGGKPLNYCIVCGVQILHKGNKKYCSRQCRRKHIPHPCLHCGKTTKNPKFCSTSCASKYNARYGSENPFFGRHHDPAILGKISETWETLWADPNSVFNSTEGRLRHHKFPKGNHYPKDRRGESNPNWKGGVSLEPYGSDFNTALSEKIRSRDNYRCQLCAVSEIECIEKLSIHHIDYNKENNAESNLISLCRSCNAKVNGNRNKWQTLFQVKIADRYALQVSNGTRILSIQRQPYKGFVYNLEVEHDHSYCGRGIIFHNCAETANLATSLLIAGDIPNSWVVLGEVRTAKDDRLLGYHAWSECPYLGSQHVMETTVDEKDVNILAPISSAYDRQSQWAQNANLYYLPQSRYNASEYIGEGPLGGMMVKLMGLPAKRVLLFGFDKTIKEKRKRLQAEYIQEARLIKRLLLEAYRGM